MSKLFKRLSQSLKKSSEPTPSTAASTTTNPAPASASAPAPAPAAAQTNPEPTTTAPAPTPAATVATPAVPAKSSKMVAKIAVLVYSLYGHQVALSKEVEAGLKEAGAEVTVFQIPEILSSEVLGKMHANKAATDSLPVITGDELTKFDGFVLSAGVRYGRQPAAVSAFFDTTGKQWATGGFVGKFATFTTSSASQHGGVESLAITTLPFLAHHGIVYVPIGFANPESSTLDEIHGSSAYGASTITGGDGSRQPTEKDLAVAKKQGAYFGNLVNTYVKGKSA